MVVVVVRGRMGLEQVLETGKPKVLVPEDRSAGSTRPASPRLCPEPHCRQAQPGLAGQAASRTSRAGPTSIPGKSLVRLVARSEVSDRRG